MTGRRHVSSRGYTLVSVPNGSIPRARANFGHHDTMAGIWNGFIADGTILRKENTGEVFQVKGGRLEPYAPEDERLTMAEIFDKLRAKG